MKYKFSLKDSLGATGPISKGPHSSLISLNIQVGQVFSKGVKAHDPGTVSVRKSCRLLNRLSDTGPGSFGQALVCLGSLHPLSESLPFQGMLTDGIPDLSGEREDLILEQRGVMVTVTVFHHQRGQTKSQKPAGPTRERSLILDPAARGLGRISGGSCPTRREYRKWWVNESCLVRALQPLIRTHHSLPDRGAVEWCMRIAICSNYGNGPIWSSKSGGCSWQVLQWEKVWWPLLPGNNDHLCMGCMLRVGYLNGYAKGQRKCSGILTQKIGWQ